MERCKYAPTCKLNAMLDVCVYTLATKRVSEVDILDLALGAVIRRRSCAYPGRTYPLERPSHLIGVTSQLPSSTRLLVAHTGSHC